MKKLTALRASGARETELAIAALLDEPHAVGQLLVDQTQAESQRLLRSIARFLETGPEPILALTDPSLYRHLRHIQTELTLRGFNQLFRRPSHPTVLNLARPAIPPMSLTKPIQRGLNRKQWMEKIQALDRELGKQIDAGKLKNNTRLEIIGAWPVIANGFPGRTSIDLDVWKSGSRYNEASLRAACAAVDLDFDPLGDEETLTRPYLQIVEAGIVQVPSHEPAESVVLKYLKITAPPGEVLIASKLLRASPKDIEDCVFLMQKFDIPIERIEKAIRRFDRKQDRELAQENLVYLSYHPPMEKNGPSLEI